MNPAIDRAVAEALGWTELWKASHTLAGYPPSSDKVDYETIPSFSTDLNSIDPALKSVITTGEAWEEYFHALFDICEEQETEPVIATATQRSLAFLAAKGIKLENE